jgi:iron(III) transport system substrate-binding protein
MALLLALGMPHLAASELTVYSTTEGDNLRIFADHFRQAHPEISVNWVRDSTGIMHARIMAEKDNPRADVLFAMAATSMLTMDELGMFVPYTPAGVDQLDPRYRDKNDPAHWVGIYGWASAVCFNTIEAGKQSMPQPRRWTDLTDPEYRGQITMPNPASSGTGFLMVSAWIQMWGEDEAWKFMDALHENVATYSHSGSKPCEQAASGEYVVGISFPFRGARLKSQGAPIEVIIPEEGTGWEMQAVAIMTGARNLEAARTFLDWSVSQGAMEAYGRQYEVTALSVDVEKPEHFPENIEEKMIDNDFSWAAREQPRIIAEWRRRYEGKSEPRR